MIFWEHIQLIRKNLQKLFKKYESKIFDCTDIDEEGEQKNINEMLR